MNTVYITLSVLSFATLVVTTPCTTAFVNSAGTTSTNGATISTSATANNPPVEMTIAITNSYGTQVSLFFGVNSGYPTPLGDPQPTTLLAASSTQYIYPTGWAGRITIGPNLNPNGSKIEGSYTGPPDIDVSYVDGYSVPITCSSEGVAVSGCNIELFNQPGITCTNQVDGPVCLNPAQNVPYGPAPYFFEACAGAAYTYPKDDKANVSNLGNIISCCIGVSCLAPSRQQGTTNTMCPLLPQENANATCMQVSRRRKMDALLGR
jgi:hypothetical protein